MTERNGARLATVLPTDSQFDVRTNASTVFDRNPYEPTHPFGVKNLKWIVGKNTPINVRRKEPTRIITTESKCSLRQVICSEREELGRLRDLCRSQCRARQFDHRSDEVRDALSHPTEHALRDIFDDGALILEFLHCRDERDHDLRFDDYPAPHGTHRGLENGAGLHFCNLRVRNPEPAAAVAEHWICLAQRLDDAVEVSARHVERARKEL